MGSNELATQTIAIITVAVLHVLSMGAQEGIVVMIENLIAQNQVDLAWQVYGFLSKLICLLFVVMGAVLALCAEQFAQIMTGNPEV